MAHLYKGNSTFLSTCFRSEDLLASFRVTVRPFFNPLVPERTNLAHFNPSWPKSVQMVPLDFGGIYDSLTNFDAEKNF